MSDSQATQPLNNLNASFNQLPISPHIITPNQKRFASSKNLSIPKSTSFSIKCGNGESYQTFYVNRDLVVKYDREWILLQDEGDGHKLKVENKILYLSYYNSNTRIIHPFCKEDSWEKYIAENHYRGYISTDRTPRRSRSRSPRGSTRRSPSRSRSRSSRRSFSQSPRQGGTRKRSKN